VCNPGMDTDGLGEDPEQSGRSACGIGLPEEAVSAYRDPEQIHTGPQMCAVTWRVLLPV
jgi:hypothetical protein